MENPSVVFVGKEQVEVQPRPEPSPGPDQIVIQTRLSMVSTGTELTVLGQSFPEGSSWARFGFPHEPGYSNIGEVVAVGESVDRSWLGRRVATQAKHTARQALGVGGARPVPEGLADEQAVFLTIAQIAMNSIRRAGVTWGESVIVYGQGLLGQLATRLCRLCGARPVIAVDPAKARLGRLPEDPAIVRVNPDQRPVAEAVREATRGRMADVAFEVTGRADLITVEAEPLRKQGRFVILSSPRGRTTFDFHELCNRRSYTIIGTHNASHPPLATPDNPWTKARHAELFFDLLRDGRLDMTPLISHRRPYVDAPRLYAMLLRDRSAAMGMLLDWTAEGGAEVINRGHPLRGL